MATTTGPDLSRVPGTLGEIRALLPPHERDRFDAALAAAPRGQVGELLEDWGAYAVGLHDGAYQQHLAALRAGRPEAIPTVPAETAHARLGL